MVTKKNFIIFSVVFLAVGAFAYGVSSARARDFFKNGAAIALQSWHNVFGGSKNEDLSFEVGLDGEGSATDTIDAIQEQTLPATEEENTSPVGKNSAMVSKKQNSTTTMRVLSPGDASGAPGAKKIFSEKTQTPNPPSVAAHTSSTEKSSPPPCNLSIATSTSHKVIFNEIAWMGSVPAGGETAAKASGREWSELKNISGNDIDVSGWQIIDSAGGIKIIFDDGEKISTGGFYLLERGDDAVPGITADKIYVGGLPNSGDKLFLFDERCVLSDFVDASSSWPGGDNTTKATLERDVDGVAWHTGAAPGGTPKKENSVVVSGSIPAGADNVEYIVSVSTLGDGAGIISSTPPGILCGFNCQGRYISGTILDFSAVPFSGSIFKGWSGPCVGTGRCSFTVTSSVGLIATLNLISPPQSSTPVESSSTQDTPSSTPAVFISTSTNHLVIAEVQIAGGASSNDFVRIFNPTASPVDISGWKLRKKSGTGTDQSLRMFPGESFAPPGGYFVWANAANGFGDSIGANVTSSETLAADNSAALFDASGTIIDAVAWGNGANQYVEGSAYPTNPAANQTLKRKLVDGMVADTGNNASDFTIESSVL